jgi:hypothetical protein
MRFAAPLLVAIALAGTVAQPSAQADTAKQQLTKPAWQGYQQYLAAQTGTRHGFFAVSKDGQIWGQSGCTTGQCPTDDALKASAISRCQQFSAGVACLIFAADKAILVPYEVKDYTAYGQ